MIHHSPASSPGGSGSGGAIEVALGLTHHGTSPRRMISVGAPPGLMGLHREAIEVFGKKHRAASYRHWKREGLTPTTDVRFDLESAFDEATANATRIHFNLDGFDVRQAWRMGHNVDPYLCGPTKGGVRTPGITNWEFVKLLLNPHLRQKTIFWQNGKRVSLARVLQRSGVPGNAIP